MKRSDPTLRPGDVVGDYEILEQVGGNMGLVFKARQRRLNKLVALKLLPGDWTKDATRLARFQREIEILGQLDHPNLVRAMDARNVDSWQLVAMEWVEGENLSDLMKKRGRIPISDACELARQAALGLQHAHEHGLIHRDIKPSNLMLARPGILKVIDMGLALSQADGAPNLTQSGMLMGTMNFCAPEQIRNPSKVDIRADIYSLGCTLYKLLAGKPPYASRKTMAEIVRAHLEEPFPSLCVSRPDAPANLEVVLKRMTEKDPAARFATPSEVVGALEPFARGADLPSLIGQQQEEGAGGAPVSHGTPLRDLAAETAQRRPFALSWIVLGVVALLVAWGMVTALKRPGTRLNGTEAGRARPIVMLMDTTAPRGIYRAESKKLGRNNAMDLHDLFQHRIKEIPAESIIPESVALDWENRSRVRMLSPDLILIHRSVFFHPMAAALGLRYREDWRTAEDQDLFERAYKHLGDRLLQGFMGDIGTSDPRPQFLIYSRGTDTNWLSDDFRVSWVSQLEQTYPALKDRIRTMVVKGDQSGTFDDPPINREEVITGVRKLLGLPPER